MSPRLTNSMYFQVSKKWLPNLTQQRLMSAKWSDASWKSCSIFKARLTIMWMQVNKG